LTISFNVDLDEIDYKHTLKGSNNHQFHFHRGNQIDGSGAIFQISKYPHQIKDLKEEFNAKDAYRFFQLQHGEEIELVEEDYMTLPKDDLNIGWFFAGFGPFRRFKGGEYDKDLEISNPRASAVISLFDEKYTLSEALVWLQKLHYKGLDGDKKSESTLNNLIDFLNYKDEDDAVKNLLPFGTRLSKVSSEGVFFMDGNGNEVEINQLSDGFRSILSLAFELIRLLIRFYDEEKVFKNFKNGDYTIDLPGVVIIDEIDAHLHPTWQTRVGQWFTKYFPALQFIVTTHSPLVCRAAENGSIWRLSAPGSKIPSGEITDADKDRLIYGNILDAYSTDAFGENLEIPIYHKKPFTTLNI
jgi:hypothetical protein